MTTLILFLMFYGQGIVATAIYLYELTSGEDTQNPAWAIHLAIMIHAAFWPVFWPTYWIAKVFFFR